MYQVYYMAQYENVIRFKIHYEIELSYIKIFLDNRIVGCF